MNTPATPMNTQVMLTHDDMAEINAINARVIGYSGPHHYAFFKMLLTMTGIENLLMLGVYHGRDIAYILNVLDRYHHKRKLNILGVDKFTDAACADWPDGKQDMSWREAGFGHPPSLDSARANTHGRAIIRQSRDDEFLATTPDKFDVVYLDTSHDYETVHRQLSAIRRICNPGAIICGDDYSDESNAGGNWGVKKAVGEAFSGHRIFADWIWFSELEYLKL